MQISRLEISNFVGISELKLDLGKVNTLSGRCGAGKTSIIEAIEKGFSNKNERVEVIRHGANNATIFIKTDTGLEIDRKIRSTKADYLRVRKAGEAVPNTEKYLKQFLSGELFKPLEFCAKSPTEQAKIILNMLEIPWTMEDIANWFGEIPAEVNYEEHILQVVNHIVHNYFSEREVMNREIATIKSQVEGYKDELPENYDGDEWRTKKVAEFYKAATDAEAINQQIASAKTKAEGHDVRIARIKAESETEKQTKLNEITLKRNEIETSRQDLRHNLTLAESDIGQLGIRLVQSDANLKVELEREIQKLKDEFEQKKIEALQRIEQKKAKSRQALQTEVKQMERQIIDFHKKLHGLDVEYDALDDKETIALEVIREKADKLIHDERKAVDASLKFIDDNVPVEVEPLRQAADEVAHMQSYLRDFDLMSTLIREKLAPREELSSLLTARIEKGRKLPQELLKIAALPVPGITVDSDGLIRVGQTLIDGLSEGEQMELAFRVAKAQAGELKLICLDGWNKINPSARSWIEKEIDEDDFQYIVVTTEDGDLMVNVSGGNLPKGEQLQ